VFKFYISNAQALKELTPQQSNMNDLSQSLLLTSLTRYYDTNAKFKYILKDIIDGKHQLSLRIIEWLVTHYAKMHNIYYWIDNKNIYDKLPDNVNNVIDYSQFKKINLYHDYRAQLKSYSKFNFDSFRRHCRITFFIDMEKKLFIETTIGQLNFFRWIFNNRVIEYAIMNYDQIYKEMVSYNSNKNKSFNIHNHDIIKTKCLLHFD
jgi:hypothetical protein